MRFATFAVGVGRTAADAVGCPAGQRNLGGGVSFVGLDPDDRVAYSEPRAGGAPRNAQGPAASGWAAAIHTGGAAERAASVWVVCAAR